MSPVSPAAARGTVRRRRRWRRSLLVLVAGLAVVAVGVGAYVRSTSHSFSTQVRRAALVPAAAAGASDAPSRPPESSTGATNYLVMSAESRDGQPAVADGNTLMVLHLAADRRSGHLVSFPPDLYVSIPGSSKGRLSTAFSLGGPQLAVSTVEQLLQTRLDHVALLDFDGLVALTDDLGGVTVRNRYATSSGDQDFPVGEVTVRGDQARAFAHDRYGLPHGELDRAQRQRDLTRAIFEKGLSRDTLGNPAKLDAFVAGAAKYITVDDQLSDAEIRRTVTALRLQADDVHRLEVPTSGLGVVDGTSVDLVDQDRLDALARALRDDTVADYAARYPAR